MPSHSEDFVGRIAPDETHSPYTLNRFSPRTLKILETYSEEHYLKSVQQNYRKSVLSEDEDDTN